MLSWQSASTANQCSNNSNYQFLCKRLTIYIIKIHCKKENIQDCYKMPYLRHTDGQILIRYHFSKRVVFFDVALQSCNNRKAKVYGIHKAMLIG